MIGQTVSHYTILEKLGQGGMGVVYKARDLTLDRFVALKFLPPHLSASPDDKARFIQEAKAASALNHPNILTIHDFDEGEGTSFIVMEFVEGTSLRRTNATLGGSSAQLPLARVLDFATQIASGLAAAHHKNIIHRDIKSDNIMVTSDGRIKIMDFGLAKLRGGIGITRAGSTVGTTAYMSPEQIQEMDVDERADIWSFGVVLYELLTGQHPFRGSHESAMMYSILNEDPRPLRGLRPDVPVPVESVVSTCLQKDASRRYPSMDQVLQALLAYTLGSSPPASSGVLIAASRALRKPAVALPALLVLAGLVYGAYWLFDRDARKSWARGQGVAELARLTDQDKFFAAFTLGKQIEQYVPDDPLLLKTWPRLSRFVRIRSEPAGARVYAKEYASPEQEWTFLGTSPLDSARIPNGFLRLKFEKDGYADLSAAASGIWISAITFVLDRSGSLPEGMVHVPGGKFPLNLSGLEHVEPIDLGDYLIDRCEVTNKEYKKFVDAGGYQKREFWKHLFVAHGKTLTWDQAMAEFKDNTGRPGPSTWEVGNYPDGHADFPVSGVSWYEAAAYAEFVGKSLPTIFHWNRAAEPRASSYIVPMSNFRDAGPDPVGKNQGLGAFGTLDMGGNVREWCWNASGEERFILGGGWNDQTYMFTDAYTQTPFDRSRSNGFRCVKYPGTEANLTLAMGSITRPFRDFLKEKPVPDGVFKFFLPLFEYDKTDLRSHVESSDTTEDWIKQKVTFNAAYGDERVIAYMFLPRVGEAPYQAVVYFPGSNAILDRSSASLQMGVVDFVIKSGRAVIYPVYKGTYERNSGITSDQPNMTNMYKEWIIQVTKDLRRSIDYLETRTDIDKEKLAFYGLSWGGRLGILFVAVETRFKASVNYVAGLKFQRAMPEVDPVNYASRVKLPVLMLNGRYDNFFPLETSQIPLYKLLGTTPQHKRHVVYETGHFVPRMQLIKEVLDWFDNYLGPVR